MTLALLAILAGGGYAAWMWLPVYLVHIEVKTVVRDYMNRAVHELDDAKLVEDMLHKLRTLDEQEAPGEDGAPARFPTVQVAREDVTWERDLSATPPSLHVAFGYTRPVAYPLVGRWTAATLWVDLTSDLSRPDWGPAR
ncbi:MAG TPA: hypothetical protein VMU15_04695 [Anaeromyxobacter sp.]|nr:hypothetical protein [Anaeromyxobacter sp.]